VETCYFGWSGWEIVWFSKYRSVDAHLCDCRFMTVAAMLNPEDEEEGAEDIRADGADRSKETTS
jgi:hypothetical protein